jgi:hypothetical protein
METNIQKWRAQYELNQFLLEQNELKGKCPKIDSYHEKRIEELKKYIENNW